MWLLQSLLEEQPNTVPLSSRSIMLRLLTSACVIPGVCKGATTKKSTRFCQPCWMAGCPPTGRWNTSCGTARGCCWPTTPLGISAGFMLSCSSLLRVLCMMTRKWKPSRSHSRRYSLDLFCNGHWMHVPSACIKGVASLAVTANMYCVPSGMVVSVPLERNIASRATFASEYRSDCRQMDCGNYCATVSITLTWLQRTHACRSTWYTHSTCLINVQLLSCSPALSAFERCNQ